MGTRTIAAVGILAGLLWAAPAKAWVVTQIEPDFGAGLADGIVHVFDANEVGADLYEIHKYFVMDENPLVLQFTREAGDQNTLRIVDEIILNLMTSQQRHFEDYHVEIINDPLSGRSASFNNPADARAWQKTGGAHRVGWTPTTANSTYIGWRSTDPAEWVPCGTFSDSPTNQLVIRGLEINVSSLLAGDSFELKEWPTTPEPATAVLLCAGLLWASKRRSGRRV